jgi:hypothetical protein
VPNAQHVKKVPGRKTDMKDAEWIADLLCHGLLRSSLVLPSNHVRLWHWRSDRLALLGLLLPDRHISGTAIPLEHSPRHGSFRFAVVIRGCGGGGNSSGAGGGGGGHTIPGTPTSVPYTVTVNATAGQLGHSVVFTFSVQ